MRLFNPTAFAALAVIVATPALAGSLDFKLGNATGYDIDAVYVGPSSSDQWTEVNMGEDILGDGASVSISFTGDPESCKWDLKVDWSEDYPATMWKDVNLCNISNITLKYDRDSDETTAELN